MVYFVGGNNLNLYILKLKVSSSPTHILFISHLVDTFIVSLERQTFTDYLVATYLCQLVVNVSTQREITTGLPIEMSLLALAIFAVRQLENLTYYYSCTMLV